ncbi:MAG: nucleotide sugar dehydrogenase [Bacillota bacterium]
MIESKIRLGTARVATVGLGYVGLPLALLCSRAGYSVLGVDRDREKVAAIDSGKSYVTGVTDAELQSCLSEQRLTVSPDITLCGECDVVLISVQTPLSADGGPDYGPLLSAVQSVSENMRGPQLVIVESTVGPGTMEREVRPLLTRENRKVGVDFLLGYSPERLDPGNEQFDLGNTTRLVSGVTGRCREATQQFYQYLGIPTVVVSCPAVAEMAKLLENAYRDVNVAFINEMARICAANRIDIWEVTSAAATKPYGFSAFHPGPGVGGHCIPVDSVYYLEWARQTGHLAPLAEMARAVNRSMPGYTLNLIEESLAREGKNLSGSEVLCLGVTYKRDVDDVRESPSLKLMELLLARGARVAFCDPFFNRVLVGNVLLQGVNLEDRVLSEADCVVLAVDHSQFDPAHLAARCSLLVDLTGVTFRAGVHSDSVVRLFGGNTG